MRSSFQVIYLQLRKGNRHNRDGVVRHLVRFWLGCTTIIIIILIASKACTACRIIMYHEEDVALVLIQLTLPESDVATMSCKAPERTAVISEAKPTQQVGEEKRKETRYAQGGISMLVSLLCKTKGAGAGAP
ncbi:hypothetical protein V6N13_138920 [Hibiscus sabdariffa]